MLFVIPAIYIIVYLVITFSLRLKSVKFFFNILGFFCWSIICLALTYKWLLYNCIALTCIKTVTNFWHLIMYLFLKKTKYNFLACLLLCFLACLLAYKLPNCVDTFITAVYHDIKNSLAEPILKNSWTKREALTTYNREMTLPLVKWMLKTTLRKPTSN